MIVRQFRVHNENTAAGNPANVGDIWSNNDQTMAVAGRSSFDGVVSFWGRGSTKSSTNDIQAIWEFLLDIPRGVRIIKVRFTIVTAAAGGTFQTGRFGLIKTGFLDTLEPGITSTVSVPAPMAFPTHRPGQWNARGTNFCFAIKGRQINSAIYDTTGWPGGRVGTSDTSGPSTYAGGGGFIEQLDRTGIRSTGIALPAARDFDLGRIHFRLSRGDIGDGDVPTQRADTFLLCEVYNVISPSNPRPVGDPIATSSGLPWNDLFPSTITKPAQNPDTSPDWAEFTFHGDQQVSFSEGDWFAFRVVGSGSDTLPSFDDGSPYLRFTRDAGRVVGSDLLSNGGVNDAVGLWWGPGGFSQAAYLYQLEIPDALEADTTNLMPDTIFEDRVTDQISAALDPAWSPGQTVVYGDDIRHRDSRGVDADRHAPGLVDLFQAWIDTKDTGNGTPYDPTGQPTALWICSQKASATNSAEWYAEDNTAGEPGVLLEITYRKRRVLVT